MKSREHLEQIAREIEQTLLGMTFVDSKQIYERRIDLMVDALAKVQDEALNQIKVLPQDAFQMGKQEGIAESLANMKPAQAAAPEIVQGTIDMCLEILEKKGLIKPALKTLTPEECKAVWDEGKAPLPAPQSPTAKDDWIQYLEDRIKVLEDLLDGKWR